ncbi:hypothetical protein [Nocardia sp. NPDC052566]|uniref:hypothetical protein n=1 Tax=Nocardia sp. NPDC052566 TaxID=3364330 RepID=UPI0037C8B597
MAVSTPQAERLRSAPVLLVTGSAVAWAVVPTFFTALTATTLAGIAVAVALINATKSITAAAAVLVIDARRLRLRRAQFRRIMVRHSRSARLLVADGVAMMVSDLCFLAAFAWVGGKGAAVTLIINGWPVLAAILLSRCLPRFRIISDATRAGALLAVLGLAVIIAGTHSAGQTSITALVLAGIGVTFEAATVVIHQLVLDETGPDLSAQPLWQATRSGVAATAAAVVATIIATCSTEPLELPQLPLVPLAAAGVLWTVSAILFHVGVSRSANPFIAAPWLLTPLLSAVLVAAKTGQLMPASVMAAAVMTLAGNALISLKSDTTDLTVPAAATVTAAAAVFTISGRASAHYGVVLQIMVVLVGVGYGLVATSVRRRRQHPFVRGSKAAVITAGLGLCVVAVVARPVGAIYDLAGLLVAAPVLFAIIDAWRRTPLPADRQARPTLTAPQRHTALIGFLAVGAAWLALMGIALTGPTGWPTI